MNFEEEVLNALAMFYGSREEAMNAPEFDKTSPYYLFYRYTFNGIEDLWRHDMYGHFGLSLDSEYHSFATVLLNHFCDDLHQTKKLQPGDGFYGFPHDLPTDHEELQAWIDWRRNEGEQLKEQTRKRLKELIQQTYSLRNFDPKTGR